MRIAWALQSRNCFVGDSAVEYRDELTGHDDLLWLFFSRNATTKMAPGGSGNGPKDTRGLIPLAGNLYSSPLPAWIGDVTAHLCHHWNDGHKKSNT